MSRRPRRMRPPLLDSPPPAAPRAVPTAPRPKTPREQLVAARVAGPHVHLSRESVLQQARALVRGEPRATLGLVEPGAVTVDDVRTAVTASHGYEFDAPRAAIDPGRTLAEAERAIARILEVASAGGRVAFATGRPASLLPYYQQLARAAHRAGADVVALEQYGPFRASGRADRHLWWIESVAVLTDGATLFADDGFESSEEWLFAVGRVDLAVADRGYAATMLAAGVETVAHADLDAVALSVSAARGRPVHLIPLDETRPPKAYAPLDGLAAFLAGMTSGAPTHPSHSTTPAPETYAHPSSGESEG